MGASLLDKLCDRAEWERFYAYKTHLACPKAYAKRLRALIDSGQYEEVTLALREGAEPPLPRRAVISKLYSQKKRVVYTYPEPLGSVLKLLTYLMLRMYDGAFSDNLYSFRPGTGARDAVMRLKAACVGGEMWAYKADISNYFNSLPVDRLLKSLKALLKGDPELYAFLERLLLEPRVLWGGRILQEEKGIMAGTPQSAFFANLYLSELDRAFAGEHVPYARYSDDIIVFAKDKEEVLAKAERIRAFLTGVGLRMNPDKEQLFAPGEGWTFLGFCCKKDTVDIAKASVDKLKGKMRRKMRALMRWQKRNGLSGDRAARAFIRVFNKKLLESPDDNELSWAKWYFPTINTDRSLHLIDSYAQECLRYLISGTRSKARFNVRYEDLKALGYRSLVHEYYAGRQLREQ